MNSNKLLNLMGIARRSGKVIAGFDVCIGAMNGGECTVVFLSSDVAERTERNIVRIAQEVDVKVIKLNSTMQEIGHSIGASKSGVVCFVDDGFEKKAKQLASEYALKIDE